MKRNEGFTLVELLVAFAVGAVVVLAATSVLLLGLRFNAISGGTAQRQNTTRILMTVFENLATEQQITSVESTADSWVINGTGNVPLLSYESASQSIYSGKKTADETDTDTVLLEGVIASHLIWDKETDLLSFHVETKDGSFSSSVYWRNAPDTDNTSDPDATVNGIVKKLQNDDRNAYDGSINENLFIFLSSLAGELGSTGEIKVPANGETSKYYSEWYIGGYTDNSWNKDTPWCACYISWALVRSNITAPSDHPKWFANVDKFMLYFNSIIRPEYNYFNPEPGDIIFFDWDGGDDPEHVGVVLYVDTPSGEGTAIRYIYTIEGNSAGIVAVRKYAANDDRIIGYGAMTWN